MWTDKVTKEKKIWQTENCDNDTTKHIWPRKQMKFVTERTKIRQKGKQKDNQRKEFKKLG